jgi:hypothetical protein
MQTRQSKSWCVCVCVCVCSCVCVCVLVLVCSTTLTWHKQIKTSGKAKLRAAGVAEAAAVATGGGIKWSTKEVPVGRALVSSHHLRSQVCYAFRLLLSSVFKSTHSSINLPNRHTMLSHTACVYIIYVDILYIYVYIYILDTYMLYMYICI